MTAGHLPFNVGQIVEARSFEKGFRGAWFRCKITDIFKKKNELFYNLEYLDFPDEKIHTTKLYQKRADGNKTYLMVRPKFPDVYHKNDAPDIKDVVEPTLVVNDNWKVGDLVDWWKDDCYWSGTLTKVMGDGKVQIKLFPVPIGEGRYYDISCNYLRPSLDWSPDKGWIASFFKDGENSCARLIMPTNDDQVIGGKDGTEEHTGGARKKQKADGSIPLNIMTSTAIEAAVFDLEELISRIKWLKTMLTSNSEKASSASSYSWEFAEYCPSSTKRL